MTRLELVGGPLDGGLVERRGALAWVDRRLRAWRLPAPGRALYRLRAGRYEHVVECPGCAWIVPVSGCPICTPSAPEA